MSEKVDQLNRKIIETWENGRERYYSYNGIPKDQDMVENEVSQSSGEYSMLDSKDKAEQSPESESYAVELPRALEEWLENHPDKLAIERDLKNEFMRWFWMGYYEGKDNE